MPRPRSDRFAGHMPGLYAKQGKKRTLYYTLHPAYVALGHNLADARRRLLEMQNTAYVSGTIGELLDEFMKYRIDLNRRTGKPTVTQPQASENRLFARPSKFHAIFRIPFIFDA
jgi:hypothetical protein